MERTLVLVKPDAMQRGLAGEVISRLERRGLKIVAINVSALVVTVGLLTYVCLSQFRGEMLKQADAQMEYRIKAFWELLNAKGTDFKIVDGKMMAGTYVISRPSGK